MSNIIVFVGELPASVKYLPASIKPVSITAEQHAAVEMVKALPAEVRAALLGIEAKAKTKPVAKAKRSMLAETQPEPQAQSCEQHG